MMKFKEIQLDFTNLQSFGAFLNVRVWFYSYSFRLLTLLITSKSGIIYTILVWILLIQNKLRIFSYINPENQNWWTIQVLRPNFSLNQYHSLWKHFLSIFWYRHLKQHLNL
jgi:hypothetical protein